MRLAVLMLALGACSGGGGSDDPEPLAIRITIPTTEATYVTNLFWVDVAGEYNWFPSGLPGSVRNLTTGTEYQIELRGGMWRCKQTVSLDPGPNEIYAWIGSAGASITVVRNE